jgi:carboxypeptidase D
MVSFFALVASVIALAGSTFAVPATVHDKRSFVERAGVKYNVFEHAATGARLEFVNNSGICETTPGVKQYSGYLSVGDNMNMFFWYGLPSVYARSGSD